MNKAPAYRYPDGRIVLFAKAPVPGKVKTRLASGIGAHAAASVYAQLLCRTVSMAMQAALAPVELHVTPDSAHPLFLSLAEREGLEIKTQTGSDLGQRMDHALQDALEHSRFAVLIGSDCPAMDADYLKQACQALDGGTPVTLGPAEDGGYVLIGLRACDERIFSDIPWGSDRVLKLTRERLQQLNLGCLELEALWDLDRPEDFERWKAAPTAASQLCVKQ